MGPFNRREFLQQSAVISAAMAALSSDDLLHGQAPATTRAASALTTRCVAVVGVRGRGMSHVERLRQPEQLRSSPPSATPTRPSSARP